MSCAFVSFSVDAKISLERLLVVCFLQATHIAYFNARGHHFITVFPPDMFSFYIISVSTYQLFSVLWMQFV